MSATNSVSLMYSRLCNLSSMVDKSERRDRSHAFRRLLNCICLSEKSEEAQHTSWGFLQIGELALKSSQFMWCPLDRQKILHHFKSDSKNPELLPELTSTFFTLPDKLLRCDLFIIPEESITSPQECLKTQQISELSLPSFPLK